MISIFLLLLVSLAGVTSLLALHPWVQLRLARHLLTLAAERSETEIRLREIRAGLSGTVRLSGLQVDEADGETLLAVEYASVQINLRDLFDRRVRIDTSHLTGVELNLRQAETLNIVEFGRSVAAGSQQSDVRSAEESEAPSRREPWSVSIASLELSDASFTYGLERPDQQTLRFSGIDAAVRDLRLAGSSVEFDLRRLSLDDFRGLRLNRGELVFALSPDEIRFDHLVLQTDRSTVRASASLSSAVANVRERATRISADAVLRASVYETYINAADIDALLPFLPVRLIEPLGRVDLSLSASVFGPLDQLQFPLIDLALGDTNRLSVSGSLSGLINPHRIGYDLKIESLRADTAQLSRFAPAGHLGGMPVPEWLEVSGSVNGSRYELVANLEARSSAGDASFRGEVKPLQGSEGTALGCELAHAVSADVSFREDLDVSLDAEINRTVQRPYYRGVLQVGNVDLQTVGLSQRSMRVAGQALFDIEFGSMADFRAGVDLGEVQLRDGATTHRLESLQLTASSVSDGSRHDSRLVLSSDGLNVDFVSDLAFEEIVTDLERHLHRYVELPGEPVEQRPVGSIRLQLELREPLTMLVPLIPQLQQLSTLSARMEYDGTSGRMAAEAFVEHIGILDNSATDLRLQVTSGPSSLFYDFRAARSTIGGTTLYRPTLRGDARGNSVSAYLILEDENAADLLRVGVRARLENETVVMNFEPRRVLLRNTTWLISDRHQLALSRAGVRIDNLRLVKDGSTIAVDSRKAADRVGSAIDIDIADFDITTVVSLFDLDTEDYRGTVSGRIEFTPPYVTATLEARELMLAQREIGDVQLISERDGVGNYHFLAEVRQGISQASVRGTYRGSAREITAEVELVHLDLDYLSGYIPDEISDASGHLSGTITVAGPIAGPGFDGRISFQDAGFTVEQLGTGFTIGNEAIEISRSAMRFSGFTIRDRAGSRAVIDGSVGIDPEVADILLDLAVNADRFIVLDTSTRQNARFYGRLVAGSNLRLTGNLAQPRALGSIRLRQGSSVTFVLPDRGDAVGDAEGVVRFVDDLSLSGPDNGTAQTGTVFRGFDVTGNLQVDPDTTVELVVDARTGDRLRMRGGGDLSLGIDPAGTISLSGRYNISSGSYVLSFYNVARREFAIAPGSSVAWTGDPFDAMLDVRATYTVRTSPAPLLARAGQSAENAVPAAELPFEVILQLQGNLSEPEVSFRIDMPPAQRAAIGGVAYAAIQQINEQESRRNTQAFSLIVLNQFVADDFSEIDETAALFPGFRRSASQLLTYQLNALSRRLIPGIDVRFEVESWEEYTERGPEGRTELGIELSQRLLDERIIVRIGGQFDIEGERSRDAGLSEIAGDVSVEYLLTPDGRYRIRGFREQGYQGPLDGSLTTTGLSFVFTHEFDRFRRRRLPEAVNSTRKREETQDTE